MPVSFEIYKVYVWAFHGSCMTQPRVGTGFFFENVADRVRSGQEMLKSSWSGRVGSGRVGSGRVGSGRVGSGRVGSGRVGSGRVRRFPDLTGRVGSPCPDLTCEKRPVP